MTIPPIKISTIADQTNIVIEGINIAMRLMQIHEARNTLTRKDAMLVLREIETGRGGVAELARKKPFISQQAQAWLSQHHGTTLKLFRAVAVTDKSELQSETVVSTTTNWEIAFHMAKDFPVIFGQKEFITNRPHLLRYDVSINRVLAYVPLLVDQCMELLGDVGDQKITSSRSFDRIPVSHIIQTGKTEEEVIVNVSGITPRVISFEQNTNGRRWMQVFQHVVDGDYKSGSNFEKYYRDNFINWRPNSWDDARKEHDDFAKQVKAFMR